MSNDCSYGQNKSCKLLIGSAEPKDLKTVDMINRGNLDKSPSLSVLLSFLICKVALDTFVRNIESFKEIINVKQILSCRAQFRYREALFYILRT